MTIKKEEALNQWLNKQLKAGRIVELKSRYVTLCFYIPKKDGSLHLVQDYWKLNQVTIKDKTPLLLIGEIIDKLKEAKYFNKCFKRSKCDFNMEEILILGVVVGQGQVQIENNKIKAVKE